MTIDKDTLLLEVGQEALDELSADELNAVTRTYSSGQVKMAGMKVFELLMKKFQPNYRMGRMYESLSQKFEAYKDIYFQYARSVGAGKLASDTGDERNIQRYDFLEETHSKQDVVDATTTD